MKNLASLLFLIFPFLLECVLFGAWQWGMISFLSVLIGHLFITAGIGSLCWMQWHRGKDIKLALLSTLLLLFFGPIGPLMLIIIGLLMFFREIQSTSFMDWYESIFPTESKSGEERFIEQALQTHTAVSYQADIVSFKEVFRIGSDSQKREALAKISQFYRPSFAPALRLALNDSKNFIRVQAATTIAKIEHYFVKRSIELLNEHKTDPQDLSPLKKLAIHYDRYAHCGLYDETPQRLLREKAIDYCLQYLRKVGNDHAMSLRLAALYVKHGAYKKGFNLFSDAFESTQSIPKEFNEAFLTCLYANQDYKNLKDKAQQLIAQKSEQEKQLASYTENLDFWRAPIPRKTLEIRFG